MTPNPCTACGSTTFVRAAVMERSGESNRLHPLAIACQPAGALEVLFCRACGKVDWFVKDPAKVPIGKAYGTELVEAAPAAPYR